MKRWGTKHDVRDGERGEGLIDAVVAAAIVSVAIAAVLGAVISATHWLASNTRTDALRDLVHREARIAVDILKYQGASIGPTSIATAAPLPNASPIPVHLSILTTGNSDGTTTITISATDDVTGAQSTLTTRAPAPAPLPHSTLNATNSGAQPL